MNTTKKNGNYNGAKNVNGERFFPNINKTLAEFIVDNDDIEDIFIVVDEVNGKECFNVFITKDLADKVGAYYNDDTMPVIRIEMPDFDAKIGVAACLGTICSFCPAYETETFSNDEINAQHTFLEYLRKSFGTKPQKS